MPSAATTSPEHSGLESRRTPANRILVVRLGAMGDVVHGLPAVAALRIAFPEARLGWLIEERWAELLCTLPTPRSGLRSPQRPLVDRIHTVNMKRWRASPLSLQTWEQIATGLSDVRAERYDVAIDLQGAVRSSLLARWSGAPVIYGFAQPRESLASMFYTRQIIAAGDHVVAQNLSLAQAVAGRSMTVPPVELPFDPEAEQECDRWLKGHGIEQFVLFNPGAGWGAKQWPPERYGQVARQLTEDGLKPLINFGPGEEDIARAVGASSGGAAEAFTGSLTQLIAIARRARLFVGGDTGPMHLSAASGVPVVGIFGPTNPVRNGPFRTRSIVLRSSSSGTSYSHQAEPDRGLLDISPEQVVAAARQLLKESHG
jgi:heptosyltransferase-1